MSHVGRAKGYLTDDQVRMRLERDGHAHVHYHDPRAGQTRQHVDGRASIEKVDDHLGCDLRGIGAHPLRRYPMVASHHNDSFIFGSRAQVACDARQLNGELLQPAQTARWFRQLCLAKERRLHGRFIQLADAVA